MFVKLPRNFPSSATTLAPAIMLHRSVGAAGREATVRLATADFPSLVAVITVVPGDIPKTMPLLPTIATDVALLDHVTTRPVKVFPLASLNVTSN